MKDLGTEPKTDTDGGVLADSITDKPTDSHTLAVEAPVVAVEGGGSNPVDHGWNRDDPRDVARLVDGLRNEDFWLLVRRFNKVWMGFSFPLMLCCCIHADQDAASVLHQGNRQGSGQWLGLEPGRPSRVRA